MWGLALIIGLIGIIVLLVFLTTSLPKEYLPIKILFFLVTPLMVSLGLFVCFKLASNAFAATTADLFESLFVISIRFLIFFYIYFAGTSIVKFVKNFQEKKYLERMGRI